ELVGGGDHQARVDHDDTVVVLDVRHVLPDLPQPAEGKDAQGSAQTALSRPCRSSAPRISACSSSEASTSGRRKPPTSWPSMLSAVLIGIGFAVPLIARSRSASDSRISCRLSCPSTIRRISSPTLFEAPRILP